MALRVKCKGCGGDVPVSPLDPARPSPGGGQAFGARCPACNAVTHYRRPEPAPSPAVTPPEYAPSPLEDLDSGPRDTRAAPQFVRLPEIVIKAAWWVRFTLLMFWINVLLVIMFHVIGLCIGIYLMPAGVFKSIFGW